MVQKDIFTDEKPTQENFEIVRPSRRLFAAIFDLVFLFSTGYLLLSPILRKASTNLLLNLDGQSANSYVFLMIATLSALTFLYQVVSVYFFAKTPGMAMMGIKLVPLHHTKITMAQALLRASLFQLEVFFLGVPFFEIWTHPKGHTLHDRGSDTKVVSVLSEKQNYVPNFLEVHFFRQIGAGFFASVLFILALKFANGYVAMFSNQIVSDEDSKQLSCLPNEALERQATPGDLDLALSLYFAGEINVDCLSQELDRKFWSNQNWNETAYLAKAFLQIDQGLEAKEYFAKACEESSSKLVCGWGKFVLGQNVENLKELPSLVVSGDLLSAKVYFANSALNLQQGPVARYILDSLDNEPIVSRFLVSGKLKLNRIENRKDSSDSQLDVLESLLGSLSVVNNLAWVCRYDMAKDCRESSQSACKKVEALADKFIDVKSNIEVSLALLKHRKCVDKSRITREDMGAWFTDAGWNELVDFYSGRQIVKDNSYLNRIKKLLASNQISTSLRMEVLDVVVQLSKTVEDFEFVTNYVQEHQLTGNIVGQLAKQILPRADQLGAQHLTVLLNKMLIAPDLEFKVNSQLRIPASVGEGK